VCESVEVNEELLDELPVRPICGSEAMASSESSVSEELEDLGGDGSGMICATLS
jgi:hypothetical protein